MSEARKTGRRAGSGMSPTGHDDAREQMAFAFEPDATDGTDGTDAVTESDATAAAVAATDAAGATNAVGSTIASATASAANAASLSGTSMLAILRDWAERGWLRELDRAFAAFLAEQVPHAPALLLLGAALASHQLGRGHVCVTLADTLHDPRFALSLPPEDRSSWRPPDSALPADPVVTPDVLLDGIDVAQWRAALSVPGLTVVDADADAAPSGDGADGEASKAVDTAANDASPLVMVVRADGDVRLYLRRYWRYEQHVRSAILQRVTASTAAAAPVDDTALRALLDCLFPPSTRLPEGAADWQKLACALMTRRRFGIVTGGPGTGKTTTVVRLLALLQCLALSNGAGAADALHASGGRALRIRLAAPTGKAAARLNDAIARAVRSLPLADLAALLPAAVGQRIDAASPEIVERLRAAIPTDVTTLHRLLGSRPDSRRFRHDADTPLALDVLVVDEASMVDLEMMSAVLAALPPDARLILLGDKDQLASVEAGAVLGELCARAQAGHYTPATCAWIEATTGATIEAALRDPDGTPLDQSIAMLRHSHRFTADSGIGRLAYAVNEGDAQALRRIRATAYGDLAYVSLAPDAVDAKEGGTRLQEAVFRRLVVDGGRALDASDAAPGADVPGRDVPGAGPYGYAHYLRVLHDTAPTGVLSSAVDPAAALRIAYDDWAREVLDAYGSFQVLCALRRGEWGVDGLNERIARTLHEAGLIALPSLRQVRVPTPWYLGRPVLVTRNDYGLGLMNGDIGITLIGPPQSSTGRATRATSFGKRALIDDDRSVRGGDDRDEGAATGGGAGAKDALGSLRVAFLASDGSREIKWVLPSRLQSVETVFAMTVHKSQGSEFDHAALVLPPRMNPILTRELVYTGMTRARKWLTLASAARDDHVLMQSIARRVLRASGLMR